MHQRLAENPLMSPAEAMLLGATMTSQCFGQIADQIYSPDPRTGILFAQVTHTCAAGAMLYAIGGLATCPQSLDAYWPWLAQKQTHCPDENCLRSGGLASAWGTAVVGQLLVCHLLVHLNDSHKWPRERIAEWLAKLEPQPGEVLPEPEPMVRMVKEVEYMEWPEPQPELCASVLQVPEFANQQQVDHVQPKPYENQSAGGVCENFVDESVDALPLPDLVLCGGDSGIEAFSP